MSEDRVTRLDQATPARQAAVWVEDEAEQPTTVVLSTLIIDGADNPEHHARLPRRLRSPKK